MVALATVCVVILVTLLIARVATVALSHTGLSRESARFQARSALTGVGFTTNEAEAVVNHPVRRRIVMALMLVGSAGLVTVVGSLILSFAGAGAGATGLRLGVLLAVLAALLLVARSRWVERRLARVISRALDRFTDLEVRDYADLLRVAGDYTVMELSVRAGDWLADRSLEDLRLRDEGVVVLGITRPDGAYLGAPVGATVVRPGDTLVVYGRGAQVCELDRRPSGASGDAAHDAAAARQDEIEAVEAQRS